MWSIWQSHDKPVIVCLTHTCSYPSSLSAQTYGRRRHNSNGGGLKRKIFRGRQQKSNTMYASRSLTKLSSSDNHNSRTNGSLASKGRSRSNLSLGHAPSMSSVREEPRRSTSTSSEYCSYCHMLITCKQSFMHRWQRKASVFS